jgi:di- and tripeptidase
MEIRSSGLCSVCSVVSDYTVPIKEEADDEPTLLQRIKHEGSVLSLAMSDEYIFAGTQRNNILVNQSAVVSVVINSEVWDINTYERRGTLKGHQGSVLCLCLSEDKKLLFSSAGDAIVKVYVLSGGSLLMVRFGMQLP